jgi:hypothetical protein
MIVHLLCRAAALLGGAAGTAVRYYRAALQRRHSRASAPVVNPSTTKANPSPASAIPADRRTAARKITTSSETTTPTHRTP